MEKGSEASAGHVMTNMGSATTRNCRQEALAASDAARLAPRHVANASLQPPPGRSKFLQTSLPPITSKGAPDVLPASSILHAGAPENAHAATRLKGTKREALYSLGFNEARTMFGAILDADVREHEMALVRRNQQQVGTLLLETWLNDVLCGRGALEGRLEALKANPITKTGLVAFGMSRDDLSAAGLAGAEIDRLYRAMYVYTVGFNDMLRDTIAHSQFRDALLGNVWRAFATVAEAAVAMGFRSSILDLMQLREEQAAELLLAQEALSAVREDAAAMDKSLVFLSGAHAEERAQRLALSSEVDGVRQELERERRAHGQAVQMYVNEVAQRSGLQASLLEERAAREHAAFQQRAAEGKQRELQAELTLARTTLATLEGSVSKLQRTLAMEHALCEASQHAQADVLERMAALTAQIETMHGHWKDEQEQRLKRQHALYEKSDEARALRLQLLELQSSSRELQADKVQLLSDVAELRTEARLQGQALSEGADARAALEREVVQLQAKLDVKRQKKRDYKASARNFQELWASYKAELASANLSIAEHVEESSEGARRAARAHDTLAGVSRGLVVALRAAQAQKAGRLFAKAQLADAQSVAAQLNRKLDIADAQVRLKQERIAALEAEVSNVGVELDRQLALSKEMERDLSREKQQSDAARHELGAARTQHGATKQKLAEALLELARVTASVAEQQRAVSNAHAGTHAKAEELRELRNVFELLKGSKEKVELELLDALKSKREAQLAANQQRSDVERALREARAKVAELEKAGALLREERDDRDRAVHDAAAALERKRRKKRHWKAEAACLEATVERLQQSLATRGETIRRVTGEMELIRVLLEALSAQPPPAAAATPSQSCDPREQADSEHTAAAERAPTSDDEAQEDATAPLEARMAELQSERAQMEEMVAASEQAETAASAHYQQLLAEPGSGERQLQAAQRDAEVAASQARQARYRAAQTRLLLQRCSEELAAQRDLRGDDAARAMSGGLFEVEAAAHGALLGELLAAEGRIGAQLARVDALQQRLVRATSEHRALENDKGALDAELAEERAATRAALAELEAARAVARSVGAGNDRLLGDVAVMRGERERLRAQLTQTGAELAKAQAEVSAVTDALEARIASLETRKDAELEKLRKEMASTLSKRDAQVKTLYEKRQQATRELVAARSCLAALADKYTQSAAARGLWLFELQDSVLLQARQALGQRPSGSFDPESPAIAGISFSDETLAPLISQIYVEKIVSDMHFERRLRDVDSFSSGDPDDVLAQPKPSRRQTLEEFVYDFFLARFGVRLAAEAHLAAFCAAVTKRRAAHKKCALFGRLLGLFDPYPEGAVDFFLNTLSRVHARCGPLVSEAIDGHARAPTAALALVVREAFKAAAGALAPKAAALSEFVHRLDDPRTRTADVDTVMELVMDAWREQRAKDELEVAGVFGHADASRRGVRSLDEFRTALRAVDRRRADGVPDRLAKVMFREALLRSGAGGVVRADAFVQTLSKHGFAGLRTHRLEYEEIRSQPPWDVMPLMEESWRAMRAEVDRMLAAAEAATPGTAPELPFATPQLVEMVEDFVHKLGDASRADDAWTAYRRVLAAHAAMRPALDALAESAAGEGGGLLAAAPSMPFGPEAFARATQPSLPGTGPSLYATAPSLPGIGHNVSDASSWAPHTVEEMLDVEDGPPAQTVTLALSAPPGPRAPKLRQKIDMQTVHEKLESEL